MRGDRMKKRVDKHRPLHINQTSNPYFVTGRTYFGLPYFNTKEEKKTLLKAIKLACKNYCLSLDGWVILDNHYHLLFRPPGCCWELGIADKSARPKRSIADKSARPREISIANKSARPREISIANKSARPVPKRSSNFSCDQVIKDFKIGKVMGTIHGKSSSLLKKIADKSARPEERNSKLACGKPKKKE